MGKKAAASMVAGGFAAVALAAAISLAGPAAAQTSGQAIAAGQTAAADRPAYCDHVDKALVKRQKVVTRLEGDADARGSIAWLNDKAAAATAAGNPELAKLYTDRSALRSQVLDPLKTLSADLTAVQQAHCS